MRNFIKETMKVLEFRKLIPMYLCLLVFTITSCDVVRVLEINTKKQSEIQLFFNHSYKYYAYFSKENNPIILKPNESYSKQFLIGYWNDENIKSDLTKHIDSIRIISNKSERTLKSEQEIQKYFESRRLFFSRSIIRINE